MRFIIILINKIYPNDQDLLCLVKQILVSSMNASKWQKNSCFPARKRKYTKSVIFPLSQGRYYIRYYVDYFISLLFNLSLLFQFPSSNIQLTCSQPVIYNFLISGRSEHETMEQNIYHTFQCALQRAKHKGERHRTLRLTSFNYIIRISSIKHFAMN